GSLPGRPGGPLRHGLHNCPRINAIAVVKGVGTPKNGRPTRWDPARPATATPEQFVGCRARHTAEPARAPGAARLACRSCTPIRGMQLRQAQQKKEEMKEGRRGEVESR